MSKLRFFALFFLGHRSAFLFIFRTTVRQLCCIHLKSENSNFLHHCYNKYDSEKCHYKLVLTSFEPCQTIEPKRSCEMTVLAFFNDDVCRKVSKEYEPFYEF